MFWFVGLSVVAVWTVFRDPAIDHRLVVAGALLPDVLHLIGFAQLHSLVSWATVLVVVMLGTRRRRRLRRRLLAVPIGGLAHLVLDATWARSSLFWWPVLGGDLPRRVATLDRPLAVVVALEVAGLAALAWCWLRFGLADPDRRRAFVRTGRLDDRTEPAT